MILALDRGLGVPPAVANLCGYVVGFFVAWRLHRGFVFRDGARDRQTVVKYAVAILCAFAANQAVLHLVLRLPVDAAVRPVAAQLAAIVSYTALQFLLMRFWVFQRRQGH